MTTATPSPPLVEFTVTLDVVEPMGMETMVFFPLSGAEICGRVEPTAGSAQLGPSVVVGEVEQVRRQLTGSTSLLRAFQDETAMDASQTRTLLAKFGLVADHVTRPRRVHHHAAAEIDAHMVQVVVEEDQIAGP